MQRLLPVATLTIFIAGCGVEVAGTAAVGATAKVPESQQAHQNMERLQQKLNAVTQAGQERAAGKEKTPDY